MTVPHYQLPRMHRLLAERGVLDDACVEHGYLGILKRATSRRDRGAPSIETDEARDLSQVNGL